RCCNDAFDHSALGSSITVHVGPITGRQLSFGLLVAVLVVHVASESVTEHEDSVYFIASSRIHVNVSILLARAKHSVLVPVRFAHAQKVSSGLHLRQVG